MPILYFQHFATQKCIWHFQSSQSTYYQLKLNANPKCDDITMTVLFSSTFLKSYQNSPTIMLLTNENVVENCSSFHFKLSLPIKLSKMCCFDLQTLQKITFSSYAKPVQTSFFYQMKSDVFFSSTRLIIFITIHLPFAKPLKLYD